VKHFHHAQVGDLMLNYERLDVVFDTDLTIFTYTAELGTRTAEAPALLGSLAATSNAETTTPRTRPPRTDTRRWPSASRASVRRRSPRPAVRAAGRSRQPGR
jgi:hypothetical protein